MKTNGVTPHGAWQGVRLPYFDILLEELRKGKHDISVAFGRHVHWGYWDDESQADGTMANFAEAAERMTRRVCDAARVRSGEHVLDVGCGFGGTVASLNDRFDRMRVTGLNIDARQLERARREVSAKAGNEVLFVEGDACEMPFDDASFDAVLAVECIFHFASRARFFDEARRVLKPGGRLTLCDLIPSEAAGKLYPLQEVFFGGYKRRLVGPNDVSFTRLAYLDLAKRHGFEVEYDEDVTKNTLPTYPVLRHVARQAGVHVLTAAWGTGGLELLGRIKMMRYIILSLVKT